MKRIAILGSTGSVGVNACRVAAALPDRIEVTALAAGRNTALLIEQARQFQCRTVAIQDPALKPELEQALPGCRVLCGPEGLIELVKAADVDMILCAIVGTAGLLPVMEAVRAGKEIALASKEVMVMAGEPVMDLVKAKKSVLIPVDSEHSAIFQCLNSLDSSRAANLILTSSGGPFRKASREVMEKATFEQALAHPVWSMGQKISIDSATLMNKALEMIEAHFLFDCPEERIRVLVHPQSVIHSMVEFPDGVVLAQLGVPDMRFPIQYAFTWPDRVDGGLERLDLAKIGHLDFEEPDTERFPALDLAREAIRAGGTMPCVMNAANEAAFVRFKNGEIGFTDIIAVIEKTMEQHNNIRNASLDDILEADRAARAFAASVRRGS
ncbi:MAG: 1-deoxy-D-xylulose-5-phosphate reductoisomerase [Lentisphaerae bacterium]|nr:1-deoxy-D-xylulose-5-phosphate reductoisomerase [Lentisphaerota bacterium]